MDRGAAMCGTVSMIFLGMAILFTFLKGKAAILIAGFNTMPKEQREQYDRERMSKDQRNAFLLWAVILGIGSILSYLTSSRNAAIAAGVIWLIVFFRDVHLDEEKAFGKYKMK
ncbi:MAG: DUF3784 domain-containing protein [Dorea sp.]|jgi:cobalamin synthase|nr:DUF3784 domain-containing protein [Dorea sp.]MCI9615871.1 DUF3784 domain-containing protein [Dorea sp.]